MGRLRHGPRHAARCRAGPASNRTASKDTASKAPPRRPVGPAPKIAVLAVLAVVGALLGAGCGQAPRAPATLAGERTYLGVVHHQDPEVGQLRSDTELLRLGAAACAGFASGVSFFSLADTMAVNDGNLPTADLGTIIKAAAESLCPRYRSRVS